MARIAALSGDLMLASRVTASLEAAGHDVTQGASLADLGDVDLIVADLETVPPERLAEAGVSAIGFYQHTDTAMKERAEASGIELAVPRSRMARDLPGLVDRVMAQG